MVFVTCKAQYEVLHTLGAQRSAVILWWVNFLFVLFHSVPFRVLLVPGVENMTRVGIKRW